MSAYLIEVDDTKDGVCYPTIVGPFNDYDEAQSFAEEAELGMAAEAGRGGYSAYHVVCDDTATQPEDFRRTHSWLFNKETE